MFTVAQRDALRERLLRLAEEDERVVAGAAVGSLALDGGDRFSDLDLTFGIADHAPKSRARSDAYHPQSGGAPLILTRHSALAVSLGGTYDSRIDAYPHREMARIADALPEQECRSADSRGAATSRLVKHGTAHSLRRNGSACLTVLDT